MMYTFGDMRNTQPETSELVEEIVKNGITLLVYNPVGITHHPGHVRRRRIGGSSLQQNDSPVIPPVD